MCENYNYRSGRVLLLETLLSVKDNGARDRLERKAAGNLLATAV